MAAVSVELLVSMADAMLFGSPVGVLIGFARVAAGWAILEGVEVAASDPETPPVAPRRSSSLSSSLLMPEWDMVRSLDDSKFNSGAPEGVTISLIVGFLNWFSLGCLLSCEFRG